MLRVSNIKLDINESLDNIKPMLLKKLKISEKELLNYNIYKESIDARRKGKIDFVYTVDVELKHENNILKNRRLKML